LLTIDNIISSAIKGLRFLQETILLENLLKTGEIKALLDLFVIDIARYQP
jgi:hypothetical protein